ncbi:MAG: choice-of-anchor J domain-containing protein, partial [Prevotella sp.]|nr:choice-of-anchor J domain-containing protein [Prevotella sp.]
MRKTNLIFALLLSLMGVTQISAQQALPYEYGFEESSPTGWTLTSCHSNSNNYQSGTSGSYNGNYVFRFYWNTNPPQYLITPELAASSNTINVSFWYKAYGSNYEESFKVGYSTTDNQTTSFTWEDEVKTNSTAWTEYNTTFPAGTKYVCIAYTANDKYYLYIDDFKVEENV